MRVSMDFEALVTFDCTYGAWTVMGDSLRVFVEKGLALPYCKLVMGLMVFRLLDAGKVKVLVLGICFPCTIFTMLRDRLNMMSGSL